MKLQKNLFASTLVFCHCTVKISLYCTVVSFTQSHVVGLCCGLKHVYVLLFILFTSKRADIVMPVRVKCRTGQSPSWGWVNKLILHLMVIAVLTFSQNPRKHLKSVKEKPLTFSAEPRAATRRLVQQVFTGQFYSPTTWYTFLLHSNSCTPDPLFWCTFWSHYPNNNNLYHVAFSMDVISPDH